MIALLTSGALSLAFTLFLTPLFIRLFNRLGWGQFIRGRRSARATTRSAARRPWAASSHHSGDGLRLLRRPPRSGDAISDLAGLMVFFLMVGMGIVGFIDDFLKTRSQRSLGLGGWAKVAGQVDRRRDLRRARPQLSAAKPASRPRRDISVIRDLPVSTWLP